MVEDEKLEELLSCLYTDFLMLKDGDWQPDDHSCDASIDVVEEIADILKLTVTDTRDYD